VEAFQTNGIAYLLKPFSADEFKAAWQKFHLLFQRSSMPNIDPALLQQLAQLVGQDTKPTKKTFTVKKAQGVYLLQTKAIVYLQAQGDFVLAFDQNGKKHVLNYSLRDLEALLDPHHFFRINRSELVHFPFIQQFEPYIKNRLAIQLRSSPEPLYTSNSRSAAFREWLEQH
jgi:DNA-binding LytR/AlgR family response regulator